MNSKETTLTPLKQDFIAPLALGLDIGGTAIKSVIVDARGQFFGEKEIQSDARLGLNSLRNQIIKLLSYYKSESLPISSIGIGCAGSVDGHQGLVRYSPNFLDGKNIPLKKWITEDCGFPCIVENDANCAAVAEWKLGAGKGKKNIVLVTLGTGVGGGFILNNALFRGATGTGGEIGHFSLHPEGPLGAHGLPGTLESYCSATALQKRYQSLTQKNLTAKEIFENYSEDTKAKQAIDEFVRHLSIALSSLANIFDPDMILLGGAVSQGLNPFLPTIETYVKSHIFEAIAQNLKIQPAQFGNIAGSLGAALLAQSN